MIEETLDIVLQKLAVLEQRLEKYYQLLESENELSFILKGSYLLESDLTNLLAGKNS